jgi:phage shock protein C
MNERLYRSVDDRVVAGVCGGIAARFEIDPSLVRVAYAVFTLLTGIFPFLVLYVIMAIIVPEEPTGFAGRSPTSPESGAVPGWVPPDEGTGPTSPAWGETAAAQPGTEPAQAAWTSPAQPAVGSYGRRRRATDRTFGLIGGIVLVSLGVWFLVRDRLDIDWGVVWAAGLMTLGVVIIVAAMRPRR